MDISSLETDLDKELNGVWHDIDHETRIKVARHGNKRFELALQKLVRELPTPIKGMDRQEVYDTGEYDKKLNRILAETVLLDWTGMKEAGEDMPYSVDKAEEYFNRDNLKDFRDYVLKLAMDAREYRVIEIEETTEN